MKLLLVSLASLCLAAAACGGTSESPGAPTPPATTDTTFSVALSAANEVPPISNAESAVTGTATVTIHSTKNVSGQVASATVDMVVNVSGLTAASAVNMAHVHVGNNTTNGGIFVDSGMAPGTVGVNSGTATYSRMGMAVAPDVAQAILNNPSNYYFNVHTSMNGAGVARGQLAAGAGGGDGPPGSAPY